jgi:enoyl-CoA hydratase/carnithine racemase
MTQVYRTLRVAPSDRGVLSVVIDAPPMNLIGPELVRDLVGLSGALESGQETRVVVLESADPEYFVPHARLFAVDLPGFGASERWEDLLSPRAMGEFLAQLIAEADLGAPHIVVPDVGTAAAAWGGEADG